MPPALAPLEYRTFDVRAVDPDRPGFSGYASTFWTVDTYNTAMAPGAFKRTLKHRGDTRVLLWQHDPDKPIGKTTTLKEDKTGRSPSTRRSRRARVWGGRHGIAP